MTAAPPAFFRRSANAAPNEAIEPMPTIITSTANPRVKDAVGLRDARRRRRQGRILIDGARELRRAIEAGLSLREVFVFAPWCTSEDARAVLDRLPGAGAERVDVTQPVFERLAFGRRSDGVLAVADMPRRALDQLELPDEPLVAVLEGVEKPGNLGAVVRSADAAGWSAVIAADARTDLYNPNAIRASLGTVFTMPLAAAPAAEVLHWLRARGLAIAAARVDGAMAHTEFDFRRPAALVLGSEAGGLSPQWRSADITPLRLPMLGAADSLNVSAAAAVFFYEARRQRG